jgi:hypothetical protein
MESVVADLLDHRGKGKLSLHMARRHMVEMEMLFRSLSLALYGDKSPSSYAWHFIPGIDDPVAIDWEAIWACINNWGI